jgi:translation initiation factor IF-2
MSGNESEAKKLKLSKPGKLSLKKTTTGQVEQQFSHGRKKAVQVEVKRTRSYAPGAGGRMSEVKEQPAKGEAEAAAAKAQAEAHVPARDAKTGRTLTESERQARARALETARRDDEVRRQHEAEAEERRKEQEAEAAKRAAEEEARLKAEAEERRKAEEEARRLLESEEAERAKRAGQDKATEAAEPEEPAQAAQAEKPAKGAPAEEETELEELGGRVKRKSGGKPSSPVRRPGERRQRGKLTITQALDGDEDDERARSLASLRRQREREKARQRESQQSQQKIVREVTIPETITVQELANRMAERGGDVVKSLMKMGVMATINQSIDADTAELICEEFGHKAKRVSAADVEIGLKGEEDAQKDLKPRAPVVTVMGHVDHGKTSLLDALRASDVVSGEAGGITQHIGAYQVVLGGGDKITFIDTPGHAAFTEMRSRGANVTDIVVLVVAADDGIKDQTVEAINHAKAAEVPIIVAINKMDKPEANPDRVKNELLQFELVPEDMGGDIQVVEVSALKRQNLDKLEEAILLQAELLELKANPDRSAEGAIVEAKLERGRGSVATVLVQRGTLRTGDIFVCGSEWGRVRALINDRGEQVEEAGPSEPVEVLGLQGTPHAGDDLVAVENEARAREIAEFRSEQRRDKQMAASGRGSLEQMLSKIKEGQAEELPLVIKSDVQGSVEAIVGALEKLSTDEVAVRVLHTGVGGINESDITLARATDALVIGFNVRANPQAREMARRDGVEIRYYSIIYNVIDDVKAAMEGLLSPEARESYLGYAEIRQVFSITKVGKVAGCMVTDGVVRRGAKVRLLRDDVVIHEGTLKSLKRFKDEVKEVREGYECGMAFENYDDIREGDQIECFEVQQVARALES